MSEDRMPAIPVDRLSDAQKQAAAEFTAGRGYAVRGPFAVMLRSPEVMLRAAAMGDYMRYRTSLPPAHWPSSKGSSGRPRVLPA